MSSPVPISVRARRRTVERFGARLVVEQWRREDLAGPGVEKHSSGGSAVEGDAWTDEID